MTTPPVQRTPDVMRSVNELMWEGLASSGRAEPVAFFCECSDPRCYRPVWLTLAAYEQARSDPEWVAVASEHEAAAGLLRIA